MVERVSRRLFFNCIRKRDARKALAFAIFVKDKTGCSVVKEWSYRKLSTISSLAPSTCRTRIHTLRAMRLVNEYVHNGRTYLSFSPLRTTITTKAGAVIHSRALDVCIRKLDRSSVKSIEQGLMAMLIVETQKRKDHIQQLNTMASGSTNCTYAKRKKARAAIVRRGWTNFSDDGISTKGLAKKLHCALNTVRIVIDKGEALGLFKAQRTGKIMCSKVIEYVCNLPISKLGGISCNSNQIFYYGGKRYIQPCTRFSLL